MGYAQCVVPHLKAQGDTQITLHSMADLPGQNHAHELVGERVSVRTAARNHIWRTVHQLHLPQVHRIGKYATMFRFLPVHPQIDQQRHDVGDSTLGDTSNRRRNHRMVDPGKQFQLRTATGQSGCDRVDQATQPHLCRFAGGLDGRDQSLGCQNFPSIERSLQQFVTVRKMPIEGTLGRSQRACHLLHSDGTWPVAGQSLESSIDPLIAGESGAGIRHLRTVPYG